MERNEEVRTAVGRDRREAPRVRIMNGYLQLPGMVGGSWLET